MAKKGLTREEREEQRRLKRVRAMGLVIIALMVLSSIAFAVVFYSTPQHGGQQSYLGDVNYEIRDNLIYADVNNEEMYFYSFPDPSIPVDPAAIQVLKDGAVIAVAFDPSDELTTLYAEQIRWDLSQFIPTLQAGALLTESEDYDFPVVNCSIATPQSPLLVIANETYASVYVNGSCVTLGGFQSELLRARDQLLYAYYEVR